MSVRIILMNRIGNVAWQLQLTFLKTCQQAAAPAAGLEQRYP